MAKAKKNPPTDTPRDKPVRQPLTKAARVAAYEAAGGRCFVLGTELRALGEWSVVSENGRAYLLSPEARRLKGGRTMEQLRKDIADEMEDAALAVVKAMNACDVADKLLKAKRSLLAHLLDDTGAVVFAGERAGFNVAEPLATNTLDTLPAIAE
jgi:hypothetical protein